MTAPVQAKPRSGGHLDVLDGLRAVAAFSVVATHVGFQTGRAVDGFWAPFLARLDFGVTLFFLLSGFLLYRPFVQAAIDLRPAPETKPFLLRRFARIFPAYWALLALTMLIRPWDHSTGLTVQRTTWTDWVEYATLTHIYFGDNPHQALTHIWSLVVEVSFYLVLPFLAGFALRGKRPRRIMRRQTATLIALAVTGPVYGVVVHQIPWLQKHLALQWLPAYFDWFALGMVLASLPAAASVDAWPRLRRLADELAMAPGTCWIIAAILFALSMTPVAGPYSLETATTSQWLAKHLLYGATAFFMLLPLVTPGDAQHPLRAVLADRRVRWLGEISYSIFLFHLVLMFTLVDRLHLQLFRGGFSTLFPLTVVAAVLVAWLSYRLIEKPAQSYVRRRTRRGATDLATEGAGAQVAPSEPAPVEAPPQPKALARDEWPALVNQPQPWADQPPVQVGPWVPHPPKVPPRPAQGVATPPMTVTPPAVVPPDNSSPHPAEPTPVPEALTHAPTVPLPKIPPPVAAHTQRGWLDEPEAGEPEPEPEVSVSPWWEHAPPQKDA